MFPSVLGLSGNVFFLLFFWDHFLKRCQLIGKDDTLELRKFKKVVIQFEFDIPSFQVEVKL